MIKTLLEPISPELHFIYQENTDDMVTDFAEKNNIDLLIALPRRHRFLETIWHKSHTKQLILHSHVPVMTLHKEA